jgi:uncharacterized DUF497 family protein
LEFEWDDAKARSNLAKHRVSFDEAVEAFRDVYGFHSVDRSMNYDEERLVGIGMANGIIYHVSYTERGDCIRVISARRATKAEQRVYDRERQR